jgi:thiosulfate/3-mercaptopyruvate sulfurtransferase
MEQTMTSTNGYANPAALVSTEWAERHLGEEGIRFVEVDVDTAAYEDGHLPGAAGWNWKRDLQRGTERDIPTKTEWESLLGSTGIGNETKVVLYGDNSNWFAAFAYWLFRLYGHQNVALMNGGRQRWVDEKRPITRELPTAAPATYRACEPDPRLRATRDEVAAILGRDDVRLVDVRSPQEYSGELLAPAHLPQEGAQRGGHIPGAANVPWATAVQDDGTFRPAEELRQTYAAKRLLPDVATIAYCRIGERSAHTWFVLKELLGFGDVRNYDGSWTEWGSLVGAPIER